MADSYRGAAYSFYLHGADGISLYNLGAHSLYNPWTRALGHMVGMTDGPYASWKVVADMDNPARLAAGPRRYHCYLGQVERVEKGQRYVVVMSTNAGLWRYVIGDVVEFDTLDAEGAPRLRIVGRIHMRHHPPGSTGIQHRNPAQSRSTPACPPAPARSSHSPARAPQRCRHRGFRDQRAHVRRRAPESHSLRPP